MAAEVHDRSQIQIRDCCQDLNQPPFCNTKTGQVKSGPCSPSCHFSMDMSTFWLKPSQGNTRTQVARSYQVSDFHKTQQQREWPGLDPGKTRQWYHLTDSCFVARQVCSTQKSPCVQCFSLWYPAAPLSGLNFVPYPPLWSATQSLHPLVPGN